MYIGAALYWIRTTGINCSAFDVLNLQFYDIILSCLQVATSEIKQVSLDTTLSAFAGWMATSWWLSLCQKSAFGLAENLTFDLRP